MIAHLKGQIIKKTDKGVIIDTGNIGYFVYLTKNFLPETKENEEISLFIHHHIKEDAEDLYGFLDYEELAFFMQLISVNGIGPKVAMETLNTDPEKIKNAIATEDETFLCKIPGIGKKTAKRLILELKDKIEIGTLSQREFRSISEETHGDVIDALIKLGYQKAQILRELEKLPKEIVGAEQTITYILKNI